MTEQALVSPHPAPINLPKTPHQMEALLLSLTREIAMGIQDLPDILKVHRLTPQDFMALKRNPRYQQLLHQARLEWAGGKNSSERVRLKAAVMIEESLPELHARMHDPKETLSSKIEVAKFIGKLSGIGEKVAPTGPAAETFKVVINLGEDRKLEISKQIPPKVIEAEAE